MKTLPYRPITPSQPITIIEYEMVQQPFSLLNAVFGITLVLPAALVLGATTIVITAASILNTFFLDPFLAIGSVLVISATGFASLALFNELLDLINPEPIAVAVQKPLHSPTFEQVAFYEEPADALVLEIVPSTIDLVYA